MIAVLDTCILTVLCDEKHADHLHMRTWLTAHLRARSVIFLPAIADYEIRRGLLHKAMRDRAVTTKALRHLDETRMRLKPLPLSEPVLHRAAILWAQARHGGRATAHDKALDGDVILAAQALSTQAGVVTDNRKHLSVYKCTVIDWRTASV